MDGFEDAACRRTGARASFSGALAAAAWWLACSCGDGPGFDPVEDPGEGDDASSADDDTDGGPSDPISADLLADPEACPPDSTLVAVRREADGSYYLHAVVGGVVELMERIGAGPALTLGETDPAEIAAHAGTVIQAQEFDFRDLAVCVTRFMEPGEGRPWPGGGNVDDARDFRDLLRSWGFDLPLAAVGLLAAAGPSNHRFLYGDERDTSLCEQDDLVPQQPIGFHQGCESDLLLRDQGSYWALADASLDGYFPTAVEGDDGLKFVVMSGPNNRTDTFYAASNFGDHVHTEADLYRYQDDRFGYVTSTPGAWREGWEDLVAWREAFVSWEVEFPHNAPAAATAFHH